MRRTGKILLWVGFAFSLFVTGFSFVAADNAYDEAGRWFAYATYQSECGAGMPSEGKPGCLELRAETPTWPAGVPITDRDLLLALGSSLHDTASAVLTISGLLLAFTALFFSLATYSTAKK